MVSDMPELCKFLSLDSCQKSFLWTHKKVLAPYLVIGLMLQVRGTEKFLHAFCFESLDLLFRVSKQGPCFTAIEEDGGDRRLVELKKKFTLSQTANSYLTLQLHCQTFGIITNISAFEKS